MFVWFLILDEPDIFLVEQNSRRRKTGRFSADSNLNCRLIGCRKRLCPMWVCIKQMQWKSNNYVIYNTEPIIWNIPSACKHSAKNCVFLSLSQWYLLKYWPSFIHSSSSSGCFKHFNSKWKKSLKQRIIAIYKLHEK